MNLCIQQYVSDHQCVQADHNKEKRNNNSFCGLIEARLNVSIKGTWWKPDPEHSGPQTGLRRCILQACSHTARATQGGWGTTLGMSWSSLSTVLTWTQTNNYRDTKNDQNFREEEQNLPNLAAMEAVNAADDVQSKDFE